MNPDEVLLEFKPMIDLAHRIGKDRERDFKDFGILASAIQCVAKNNQDLRPDFDKLSIHAP